MRCLSQIYLNSNNSPFRFNAKELDEETGNYYYGARYYDPKWSIWISVDPLAEYYPSISPYSYTFNNPINWTDSTGMCPDRDCPDGVFEDGYEHTTEDGRTYFYLADVGRWSEEGVLVVHNVTFFEKVSKWFEDLFSGAGGAPVYGSGSENRGRKDGEANMDPIDASEMPGAIRGGKINSNAGKNLSKLYLKGTKYLNEANQVGTELGEKLDENKISLEPKQYIFTTYGYFDTGVNISKKDTIQINNNKSPKEVSDSLNTKAKNRWGIETKSRYEKL